MMMAAIVVLAIPAYPKDKASEKPKSPAMAMGISLAATAVPIGLILANGIDNATWGTAGLAAMTLVAGPALGYFYGGVSNRGIGGMGIRAALVLGIFLGGDTLLSEACFYGVFCAAAYDVFIVGEHVRKRNLELQKKTVSVRPIVIPDRKGMGFGVQVQISL